MTGPGGRPSDAAGETPQNIYVTASDGGVAAYRIDKLVIDASAGLALSVPCTATLPPAPRFFIGRDRELQQILKTVDSKHAVAIYAIDGMPGVGKTGLAVRAAHLLADRFPDGQFFVELHAHTEGQAEADPNDALGGLLIALGVDPRNIPDNLTGRQSLWRDRMADKKALLVLDDAASRAQVEPLLPSGRDCLTLITSRHRFVLLPDMCPLPVDVLDPEFAEELFMAVAHRNREGDGEKAAAAQIAGVCGRLPLAIGLVAGRVAHHPGWTSAELISMAEELAATTDRLAALDTPNDPVIRAAFDLSYRDLPPAEQQMFRRLGLHVGLDIDAYAAGALAGVSVQDSRSELNYLYTDHFIEEVSRGRYRMHDLLRSYARSLADRDHSVDVDRAIDGLLTYYQETAARADQWLARRARPDTYSSAPDAKTKGGDEVQEFDNPLHALKWMRDERDNLLACLAHAADRNPSWFVTTTGLMAEVLQRDGPWSLAERLHEDAAVVAQRLGDGLGAANALNNLGLIRQLTGEPEGAAELHRAALALHLKINNRIGEANTLNNLGNNWHNRGDFEQAAEFHRNALALHFDVGNRLGQGNTLNDLGLIQRELGDYEHATQLLQQAEATFNEIGNRLGMANNLNNQGLVSRDLGDYEHAASLFRQALDIYQEIGPRVGEARATNNLGLVYKDIGEYELASTMFRQAFDIHREIGNRLGEASALNNLGHSRFRIGELEQATKLIGQALSIYREIGNRPGEASALNKLGLVQSSLGHFDQAADLHRQAAAIFRDTGSRQGEADAVTGLGHALLVTTPAEASGAFKTAFELTRSTGHHLEQARALEGIAQCCARLGDTAAAVTDLRSALEVYRRLGVPEANSAASFLAELEDGST